MSGDEEIVKVRIEVGCDGMFCALDATDTMITQNEDFVELTADVQEIIRLAHGGAARAVLLVGGGQASGRSSPEASRAARRP